MVAEADAESGAEAGTEPGAGPRITTFRYDGGISEFAEFLAPDAAISDTWRLTGSGTFTETVPVLQPGGAMVPTDVERTCEVDVAVQIGGIWVRPGDWVYADDDGVVISDRALTA